jgi:acyl-CoA synthetase (AMP-forming)/AMP-acid ligase II
MLIAELLILRDRQISIQHSTFSIFRINMIYRSPRPPVDIPHTSVAEFVLARARARGHRPALIDSVTGRTITYEQLPELVAHVAAGLARLGLGKGDVCAILSPNTPEYPIAMLAIAKLGAIATTASPLYTKADLGRHLTDSRAKILITSAALASTWRDFAGEAGLDHVITFESAGVQSIAFNELLSELAIPPNVTIDPSDIVTLPYSSGTTGLPKGVMLTHRNLIANILQIDASNHYLHDCDTTIAFLPFFHIYGMVVIGLLGLWSGATLVVMPRFDLETYLQLVERHRATVLHVVPPVVVALAKHPSVERRDFSSIRKLFSGAAPLGASTIEQCTCRINCVLQQGYGLTETSPATHVTSEDPSLSKYGSIGYLVSNTECRVVDPATGDDVATGQDGEIWLRGPQVMRGYLNCPDATRATIDADGWLHSGDIGHADADGNFYVVDRLKELIKYKGMQVAPAELEALLLTHPAIADAAVVPLKDDEAGEIPRAFIVLKGQVTADEVIAFVAERVAAYKKIRRVDFIDAIPKSPSGKILRRLLRDVAVPS